MARVGRRFGWLWAAYAVSSYGTGLGFGAFAFLAIRVLHAGATEIALLSAAGTAVGAALAVPLGPWVEFRRKRPVMVAMDLVRFGALATVPVAYVCGALTFVQLLVVSVVAAAAKIAFRAASGAYLKMIVAPEHLLAANGRFESTTWTSTVLGPSLGGAVIALCGPVATVVADAASYLVSAACLGAAGGGEPEPVARRRGADGVLDGWRHILGHPVLRPLFLNTVLVSGLIMATEPLLAVLMLGRLGFSPWEYTLAFGLPCAGGLVGARLARPLVGRYGQHAVLLAAGTLRACWPVGLAFVRPGAAGLVLVLVLQFCLVTCIGVFNPVLATYRLDCTGQDRVARTLAAWTVTSSAVIAALTGLWGVLADVAGVRTAIAAAGLLMLATPLLLPAIRHASPSSVGS
ncbi:MFS transporter [Actinomadura rayongensis]|uniref:MFS transporter n=1 Tax=Actinomadura rayongensis TaxID=1429076 RepID=A0A6I4WAP8_9ACTN|nr:MFS transporter [Actinomadura rayongensis]MXQ65355.1 MFS transporter [Actinomadura rayongensis]